MIRNIQPRLEISHAERIGDAVVPALQRGSALGTGRISELGLGLLVSLRSILGSSLIQLIVLPKW